MWWKILYHAYKRNGWRSFFLYLSNLDVWRFIEYSKAYGFVHSSKDGGKIVDLGGGYSVFPSFFSGEDYTLIDISANACSYQNEHKTKAVPGDITCLPIESDSIATAIAISSIEHVPADALVIKEISRVLTDDGIAVLSVPFSHTGTKRVTIKHPQWPLKILRTHPTIWKIFIGDGNIKYFTEQIGTDAFMKCYSLADLMTVLEENNLRILEFETFGKRLTNSLFSYLPPGWLVIKDWLIGWPLYKFERAFLKNDPDARGIVLKVGKTANKHG
jgi:SAM-dependent methyltransferase